MDDVIGVDDVVGEKYIGFNGRNATGGEEGTFVFVVVGIVAEAIGEDD